MSEKTREIRFISSDYKELFTIPDGGSITITYPPGDGRETITRKCTFLDEMHVTIEKNGVFHICEFAERMEAIGARYEPKTQLLGAEITPYSVGEEKYFSRNREEGNACIGLISGDFGQTGDRFFRSWNDFNNVEVSPELHAERHSVIYEFRKDILKDYFAMKAYCESRPDAKIAVYDGFEHYGFKLETEARRYYLSCFCGEVKNFSIFAYDKPDLMQTRDASEPQKVTRRKSERSKIVKER